MQGLVYKSTGSWYIVKLDDGNFIECRVKGKLRTENIKSTNPIAVGDVVNFELEVSPDKTTGTIYSIENRKNYIIRKSVNLSHQKHIIASNIDQVFLLITVSNPQTSFVFIDRFLASAEAYHIKTILIFSKIDLLTPEELNEQLFMQSIYEKIGYECMRISSVDGKGVEELRKMMMNNVNMFSGHSGVGKTTLINALHPIFDLKTQEISEANNQGQHTTTFAEMFDLPFGAKIIDTPGIKGFGLVEMETKEVSGYFLEFFRLKNKCKYNNCLHRDEPKCAIKEALEKDEISWTRYNSYLQIIDGDNSTYRTKKIG